MNYYTKRIRASVITLILLLSISGGEVFAQKVFQEGVLKYDVTIRGIADQEGIKEYKGTYTITVKGNLIRKELTLDNGFNDVTIINGNENTVYSLRSLGKKNYAIEVDNKALKAKNSRWEGYQMSKSTAVQRTIADLPAVKSIITYTDGSDCEVFYNKDWQPNVDLFEYFPSIKVMPLAFVISNSNGMQMHFSIRSIKAEVVENALFRVPKGYKVVSYDEYQQINR